MEAESKDMISQTASGIAVLWAGEGRATHVLSSCLKADGTR